MRKTKKSAMYTFFRTTKKDWNPPNFDIVVDGEFLMYKVIWPSGCTVSTICEAYIKFIKSHYPGRSCTVVFDGYTNTPNSTKASEQEGRYWMKKSADINFNLDTGITVKQDYFLSSEHNKSRLITLLISQLDENGIETRQAPGNADLLIVTTAIDKSKPSDKSTVAVIGDDVNLAVLLMAKTPPDRDIFLVKPGRGNIKTNVYSTKEMQQLGLKDILFLHAFTGCDTTSAAFQKSKVGFMILYQKNPDIHKAAEVFSNSSSSHAQVEEEGKKCLLRWYGATAKETSLNLYRYQTFVKSVANVKIDILSLPPTEGAAKQHSYRTYHQVQQWLGNELSPELWGWVRTPGNHLAPVQTEDPAAPDDIFKMIFCRCTKDCSSGKCRCREASLKCSPVCQKCHGNCLNGIPVLENEDDNDEEPELPPTLVEELDDEVEENFDEQDEEYQPQPGPSRPKRSKFINESSRNTRFITLNGFGNETNPPADLRSKIKGRAMPTPSVEEEFIEEEWEEEEVVEEIDVIPAQSVGAKRVAPTTRAATKWKKIDISDLVVKKEERCLYWPSCKKGSACQYIHPSVPCSAFPNCKFRDKCIYIHPNCKFGAECPFMHTGSRNLELFNPAKPNCPFMPTGSNLELLNPAKPNYSFTPFMYTGSNSCGLTYPVPAKGKIVNTAKMIKCKLYPKCMDMKCPFMHPTKMCKKGKMCPNKLNCLFVHPETGHSMYLEASKSAVKLVPPAGSTSVTNATVETPTTAV